MYVFVYVYSALRFMLVDIGHMVVICPETLPTRKKTNVLNLP